LQAQHAEVGSLLAGGEQAAPGSEEEAAQRAAVAGRPAQGQQSGAPVDAQGTFIRGDRKVGRNEPCPCGSGKKFKHCHGALTSVE
jgi:preprotein translocase subunit SecA